MYKAIKKIGEYNVGDEVPEEKAKLWLEMYNVPHVEKIDSDAPEQSDDADDKDSADAPEQSEDDSQVPGSEMHDDYLNRNADVVKKAIEDDKLEKPVLENLLKIEVSNKGRKSVIEALKLKSKSL